MHISFVCKQIILRFYYSFLFHIAQKFIENRRYSYIKKYKLFKNLRKKENLFKKHV